MLTKYQDPYYPPGVIGKDFSGGVEDELEGKVSDCCGAALYGFEGLIACEACKTQCDAVEAK